MADSSFHVANNTSVEMSLLKNQSMYQGKPWEPPSRNGFRKIDGQLTKSQVQPFNPQLQIGQHLKATNDDGMGGILLNGKDEDRFKLPPLVSSDRQQKKKHVLSKDEEFVEYKHVEMPDGTMKRKKIIKRMKKKIKYLTHEQKEEIDNAFLLFDKDKSGSIDVMELKDAMKALGIFLKRSEVKETMRKVDKDGSGAIDKDEFTALMAEQIEVRDQEKELAKVFRIYDDDDAGLISQKNLERCARDLEETEPPLTK